MLARHLIRASGIALWLSLTSAHAEPSLCRLDSIVQAESWGSFEAYILEVKHTAPIDWFAWLARLPGARMQSVPIVGHPPELSDIAFGAQLPGGMSLATLKRMLPKGELISQYGPIMLESSYGNPASFQFTNHVHYREAVLADSARPELQTARAAVGVKLQITPFPWQGLIRPAELSLTWKVLNGWQPARISGIREIEMDVPVWGAFTLQHCMALKVGEAYVFAGLLRGKSPADHLTPWQQDMVILVQPTDSAAPG